ncbi:MAG TPA: sulfite exporter TauE/SafE family protein [Candidatus Sulfotelmatobacter sp.]|nr:sulfite exporter TauE/SafE family protein [Candidatus Sulfotelmatobacter sp.]
MTPLGYSLSAFGISLGAGFLGSLVGIGGGIIVVPALTLIFGFDIRHAIGASIVSVIATSSGAAAGYVRERMTNLRAAMLLELGTTIGAVCGALLAGVLHGRWLYLLFGLMLLGSGFAMLKRLRDHAEHVPPSRWADALRLHSSYFDERLGREVYYRVARAPLGLLLMLIAGLLSGLLGIGSGVLKVPAMDLAMGLPLKVSSATSNLMIGVTAAASAAIYFTRGDINPFIAGPVAIGIVLGAAIGARFLSRASHAWLRILFVAVLAVVALQMIGKGLGR